MTLETNVVEECISLVRKWEEHLIGHYRRHPESLTLVGPRGSVTLSLDEAINRVSSDAASIVSNIQANPRNVIGILHGNLTTRKLGKEVFEESVNLPEYSDIRQGIDSLSQKVGEIFAAFYATNDPAHFLRANEIIDQSPTLIELDGLYAPIVIAWINGIPITFGDYASFIPVPSVAKQRAELDEKNYPNFPRILYKHMVNGKPAYLDLEEFKGKKGTPIFGLNSQSGRAVIVIQDGEVREQKGGMISSYYAHNGRLHSATNHPIGVFPLEYAQNEAEVINRLAGTLGYSALVHDLGLELEHDKPNSYGRETSNFGVLERRGKIGEFAPNIRFPTLQFGLFLKTLLERGYSLEDAIEKCGQQLGSMHSKAIYHLWPHIGNLEVHGNLMDFEGSVYNGNINNFFQRYMDNPKLSDEFKKNIEKCGGVLLAARDLDTILNGPHGIDFSAGGGQGLGSFVYGISSGIEHSSRMDSYAAPPQDNILFKKFLTAYLRALGVDRAAAGTNEILADVSNRWTIGNTEKVLTVVYGDKAPQTNMAYRESTAFAHLPLLDL